MQRTLRKLSLKIDILSNRLLGGLQMKLVKMIINNYRQFEKAELDFDDNVTIIAGANNSGKTSLVTLIKNYIFLFFHAI